MTKMSKQNQPVKEGIVSLKFARRINPEKLLGFTLLLFLPTQCGKHFWPDYAIVLGLRIDYLSPTFYFTDFLIFLLFVMQVKKNWKIIVDRVNKHFKSLCH